MRNSEKGLKYQQSERAKPNATFKSAISKQPRRAFTIENIELLHRKAPDDFWRYTIGVLYTGLRMGELICLKWSSVDFSEGVLRVIPMKTSGTTGKTVQVPIHPTLRVTLEKLWTEQRKPKRGPLWQNRAESYRKGGANTISNELYEILSSSCGLVGLREDKQDHKNGRDAKRQASAVSFHSLRHTFVTFLKITGANIWRDALHTKIKMPVFQSRPATTAERF